MASSPATRADPPRTQVPETSTESPSRGTVNADQLTVVNRPDNGRYELHRDGQRVGLADYSLRGNVMTIPHVETDPAHRGKNFAARLMAGILDDVRSRSLTVRPLCPYADAYMRRNPATEDLRAN